MSCSTCESVPGESHGSRAGLIALCAVAALSSSIGVIAGESDWTIVDSFPLPEGASGLAFDGAHLYCGIYGADGGRIYRIDPETGATTLIMTGEHEDAFGLSFDGERLWTTDHPGSSSTPAQAVQLHWDGTIAQAIDLPDHYMSGIACDLDSADLWVARYYPDPGHLYRVSDEGQVLQEFDGPDDQPWDIAIQDDTLWVADYWGDAIQQLDAHSGELLASHSSEGVDPAGVVWDGEHLWYCDNGDGWDEDRLYKVALSGGGTPAIDLDMSEHHYGMQTIGSSNTYGALLHNVGTATLIIDEVDLGHFDLSLDTSLPLSIDPGQSEELLITWSPTMQGDLIALVTLHSNDPVNDPVYMQLTGVGVYAGPYLHLQDDAHYYADVRLGASTRWFIEATNLGDQSLDIANVTSSHVAFTVEDQMPMSLGPLQTGRIPVWFTPGGTDTVSGEITLHTNDPMAPATVDVSGNALEQPWPLGSTLWSIQITGGWDNTPKAMQAIGDVNGDGYADVIVCSEDSVIRCLHGNASTSGDVLWSHEIYSGPVYSDKGLSIVPDHDGDGMQEVVVGVTGGARLVRMISGRTGDTLWTFHTDIIGDGGWVYQVDGTRDFTGDGVTDVLACAGDDGLDTGPRRAWCLDGLDGSIVWSRPVGGPVFGIIPIDDCTGDGLPDALIGCSNAKETQGNARVLDGADGSVIWSFDTIGSSVWALAQVGDIDGDGVRDVMIGDFSTGQVLTMQSAWGAVLNAGGVGALLTGFKVIDDVSGDGLEDVVPEYFGNSVRVLNGNTCHMLWSTPVADSPAVAAVIPDISGDGVNDLLVGTLFIDNVMYAFDGVDGTVLLDQVVSSPVDSMAVMPDVVGDGSWECLVGLRDGDVLCLSGGLDAVVNDPADVDGDGIVGVNDLLLVLSQWGTSGPEADINDDGIVNVSDVLAVLAAWMP
ncbi:MAG: PQQ-binding-like beta-propeller repeat protein [Phycisphaerales bacterium]|nr:PQQ-binding-like beta-propeller repeat protein [Phycisphaerales bacterium]